MKHLVELFQWGFEGEFEQEFFISDIPTDELVNKLKSETKFTYTPEYDGDEGIGYMTPFQIIYNKLLEWGLEPINVCLTGAYVEHLTEYICVDRDISTMTGEAGVTIEFISNLKHNVEDEFFIEQNNVKFLKRQND
jgi:hypothetical protein